METKVLLIPSPLGDETDLIYEIYKSVAQNYKIDTFFVESRKLPIKVIKQICGGEIKSKQIEILDKNTHVEVINEYIEESKGKTVAIITDAGIPGISDPGTLFIRKAHKANYIVKPLIAESSITASLASSGLSGEGFVYHGYLEREKEKRINQLKELEENSKRDFKTQIFIETPYRNIHVWRDILNTCSGYVDLSVSIDLFKKDEFIKTAFIKDWNKMKWPEFNDKPTVFLFNTKTILN